MDENELLALQKEQSSLMLSGNRGADLVGNMTEPVSDDYLAKFIAYADKQKEADDTWEKTKNKFKSAYNGFVVETAQGLLGSVEGAIDYNLARRQKAAADDNVYVTESEYAKATRQAVNELKKVSMFQNYEVKSYSALDAFGNALASGAGQLAFQTALAFATGGLGNIAKLKGAGNVAKALRAFGATDLEISAGAVVNTSVMWAQIFGNQYQELKAKGIDPTVAANMAALNASAQAPLEQISLGRMMKAIPVKGTTLARQGKDVLGKMITEGVTEFLQQYPEEITNLIAENPNATAAELWEMSNQKEWFKNAAYAGSIGFLLAGGHGGINLAAQNWIHRGEIKHINENAKERVLSAQKDGIKDDDIRAKLNAESGNSVVEVDAEALQTYMQQAGDPKLVLETLRVDEATLTEAVQNGETVEILKGDYTMMQAKDENFTKSVGNYTSFEGSEFTPANETQRKKIADIYMQSIGEQIAKDEAFGEQIATVVGQLETALKGVGTKNSKAIARSYAKIIEAYAKRYNPYNPADALIKHPLTVQGLDEDGKPIIVKEDGTRLESMPVNAAEVVTKTKTDTPSPVQGVVLDDAKIKNLEALVGTDVTADKIATAMGVTTEQAGKLLNGLVEAGRINSKGNGEYTFASYFGDSVIDAVKAATEQGTYFQKAEIYNPVVEEESQDVLQKAAENLFGNSLELNAISAQDPKAREYQTKIMKERGMTQQEIDDLFSVMDGVIDEVMEIAKGYGIMQAWQLRDINDPNLLYRVFNEKYKETYGVLPVRSSFKKNGEYAFNFDLGALCTKRESMNALIQMLAEEDGSLVQNLGPTQLEALKSMLKEEGFLTACDICFVETKRVRALNDANKWAFEWKSVLLGAGIDDSVQLGNREELTAEQLQKLNEMAGNVAGMSLEEVFNKYIPLDRQRMKTANGKSDLDSGITSSKMQKVAKLILEDISLAGEFNPALLLTTQGTDWLFRNYAHTGMAGAIAGMYGAATAKPLEGLNIYDALSWYKDFDSKKVTPEEIYDMAGFRAQSFTDFNPIMFVDYLQMFFDLQARKLPIHIYTKVPSLIELFGRTGGMFNMSLVAEIAEGTDKEHAGLKKNEKGEWEYAWASESFPVEKAMELRRRDDFGGRVGTIAVGLSKAHILKMLDDENIDMIIPYHSSGMPASVKLKTGLNMATDYTKVQETKRSKDTPKDAVEPSYDSLLQKYGDPRKAADAYKQWCKDNHCTPKFDDFKGHTNYYKLLENFRGYDNNGNPVLQGPVKVELTDNWKEVLDQAMAEREKQQGMMENIKTTPSVKNADKTIIERAKDILKMQRLDGEVRDVMMKRLGAALGKKNVISLKQNDFINELEKEYQKEGMTELAAKNLELFRKGDGVVYGYSKNGKIVLNETVFNANTPAHEFSHIWAKVAQIKAPELWAEGVALLKTDAKEIWDAVVNDPKYANLKDDNAIASEVLARVTGGLNEEFVRGMIDPTEKMAKAKGLNAALYNAFGSKKGNLEEKKRISQKLMDWILKFYNGVRSLFDKNANFEKNPLTYEEFIRMPLKTLWDDSKAQQFQTMVRNMLKEQSVEASTEMMTAFHGSPFNFEQFTLDHIGKGQGKQVHGWGLYFTENSKSAERYKTDGESSTLYKVDIPESDVLLDEQSPYSQQPEKVKTAIKNIILSYLTENDTVENRTEAAEDANLITGSEQYSANNTAEELAEAIVKGLEHPAQKRFEQKLQGVLEYLTHNTDEDVSRLLNEQGVKGIKYEDKTDGTCYVVFDNKAIKILDKINNINKKASAIELMVDENSKRNVYEYSYEENQNAIKAYMDSIELADIPTQEAYGVYLDFKENYSKEQLKDYAINRLQELSQKTITDPLGNKLYFEPSKGIKDGNPETWETYALHFLAGKGKGVEDVQPVRAAGLKILDKVLEDPLVIVEQKDQINKDTGERTGPGNKLYIAMFEAEDNMLGQVAVGVEKYEDGRVVTSFITKNRKRNKNGALTDLKKHVKNAKNILYFKGLQSRHLLPPTDNEASQIDANLHSIGQFILPQSFDKVNKKIDDERNSGVGYSQKGDKTKGTIKWNNGRAVISLFKGADASTVIHETGHFFVENLIQDVLSGKGTELQKQDLNKLFDYCGIKVEDWNTMSAEEKTNAHEKLAEAFETYLMEGKAPAKSLADVFKRIKDWMLNVYKNVARNENAKAITDDVRQVFDHMLATEEELAQVERINGYMAGLPKVVTDNLSDKAKKQLANAVDSARGSALAILTKQSMVNFNVDRKEAIKNYRLEIAGEITEQVQAEPLYAASKQVDNAFSMRVKNIAQKYIDGEEITKRKDDGNRETFEVIANANGFSSGDELAKAIINSPTEAQAIKERINAKVQEKFPDIMAERKAAEEAAQQSFYNDESGILSVLEQVLIEEALEEARATSASDLAKARLEGTTEEQKKAREQQRKAENEAKKAETKARQEARKERAAAIRQMALNAADNDINNRLTMREVRNVRKFIVAERNAASKVATALAKKDYETALEYKRMQIYNHAMVQASLKARDTYARGIKVIKAARSSEKANWLNEEHFSQIGAFLARMGVAKPGYNPSMKEESFRDYLIRMQEQYDCVEIAPWLIEENPIGAPDTLTLSQFNDVVDAVRNLRAILKAAKGEDLFMKGQDYAELKQELFNAISNKPTKWSPNVNEVERPNPFASYLSNMKNMDTFFEEMDGYEYGFFSKLFAERVTDANDKEFFMMKEFQDRLGEAYKEWLGTYGYEESSIKVKDEFSKHQAEKKLDQQVYYDELKTSVDKHILVKMLMYLGSESSANKLCSNKEGSTYWEYFRNSDLWTDDVSETKANLITFLSNNLTAEDVRYAQKLVDAMEMHWEELSALERRTKGFRPKKVMAIPVVLDTPNGPVYFKGGYVPLVRRHDGGSVPMGMQVVDMNDQPRGGAGIKTMHTNTGSSKSRDGSVYPLDLRKGIELGAVQETIHDICFRELVAGYRKLINDKEVYSLLKSKLGVADMGVLEEFLTTVAKPYGQKNGGLSNQFFISCAQWARARTVNAAIVFNFKTAAQNLSNVALYGDVVDGFGYKDVVLAYTNWFNNIAPADEYGRMEFIKQKSAFMAERMECIDVTIRDIKEGTLKVNPVEKAIGDIGQKMLVLTDNMSAVPVWYQAFSKKIGEGASEREAVRFADLVIRRTLGSSRATDVAAFQRGNALSKLFTVFQGFFITQYNQALRIRGKSVKLWDEGRKGEAVRTAFAFLLSKWLIACLLNVALGLENPFEEDNPDARLGKTKLGKELIHYPIGEFGPVAAFAIVGVDRALKIDNYGYRGTPVDSMWNTMDRAMKKISSGLEKDDYQGVAEGATSAIGQITGTPAQFNKIFWNGWDVVFNGMDLEWGDLFRRRPKRDR